MFYFICVYLLNFHCYVLCWIAPNNRCEFYSWWKGIGKLFLPSKGSLTSLPEPTFKALKVMVAPLNKTSSVQFGHSVMSNSLRPHGPQHAMPPCPSPNPGVHSNSCPLTQWCHPTISSPVVLFSSCPQSFPASGSFQMSQFFTSGGQSIGVSASTSVPPMTIQDWFSLGWTGWISLQSKGLSRVCSSTTVQKHQFFSAQLSL